VAHPRANKRFGLLFGGLVVALLMFMRFAILGGLLVGEQSPQSRILREGCELPVFLGLAIAFVGTAHSDGRSYHPPGRRANFAVIFWRAGISLGEVA
jgi:hypothetical protein